MAIREPIVGSTFGCLLDGSGNVLWERNKDVQHKQASTTKFVTALVMAQNVVNWDTESALCTSTNLNVPAGSTVAGLIAGDRMSLHHLLYAMLFPSGNDAAQVIADYVGGAYFGGSGSYSSNLAAFVAAMNAFAVAHSLTNSHYANPHGIDATGHYSSAYDMANIGLLAAANARIAETGLHNVWRGTSVGGRNYTPWVNLINAYGWLPGHLVAKGGSTSSVLASIGVAERKDLTGTATRLSFATMEEGDSPESPPFYPSRGRDAQELFMYGWRTLGMADQAWATPEDVSLRAVFGGVTNSGNGDWVWLQWDPVTYSDGTAHRTATPGDYCSMIVRARGIGLRVRKGTTAGKLDFYADGNLVQTVDLWHPYAVTTNVYVHRWPVSGWHELKAILRSDRNASSLGFDFLVDCFVVEDAADPEG